MARARGVSIQRDVLTVQGLLDLLLAVEDRSLPVSLEGCDCWQDAASVVEVNVATWGRPAEMIVLIRNTEHATGAVS